MTDMTFRRITSYITFFSYYKLLALGVSLYTALSVYMNLDIYTYGIAVK